jgi:ABC-2 type transport system permease protein
MSGLCTIFRRELAALFLAPLAWALLCLALLFNGIWMLFYLRTTGGMVNQALAMSLGDFLSFWLLMLALPPLLTMRMISDESRSGMLEYLLTAPVADAAVVVGKALAATAFLAVLWASVPLYGALCAALGAAPDWGQLGTAYLGAVLTAGLFTAIGILASAVSGTPLLAAFLALVTNLGVLFLPLAGGSVRGFAPRTIDWLTRRVDVVHTLRSSFLTGALDTQHLVFFLAWTAAILFAAVRVVEARRWWA